MQAVSVYADSSRRQHMVVEYSSSYSSESAEAYLYQFNSTIISIDTIVPLWDEMVLATSETNSTVWIINTSTRKIATQFQFNFSCLAITHYIVGGFSDVQLFANTPIVRCSGCNGPAERKVVIAILTEDAVKLIEFTDQTGSFRPLTDIPIKGDQDSTLARTIFLTAQHVVICRHKRVLSAEFRNGSSSDPDQYPSAISIYYLGETGGNPVCIPIPGAVCSILLEEDDGTDTLIIQFTTRNAIITKKYKAPPLSNIWTIDGTDDADAYLVDILSPGVYHNKTREMAVDIIQYTRPAIPYTIINNSSGNAAFAYRNGVLVLCDSYTLRIFIGNILLGQASLKIDQGEEWEPLHCVLTEKLRLIIHARTTTGTGIFVLGKTKTRKESCVAIAQKRYPVPFTSHKGIWIPMEDKILCIEDNSAQCLTLDRDRCTVMQATEGGDVEIFFGVGARVVSLVFLSRKGTSVKDPIDDQKVSIALLYEQLKQAHQLKSLIEMITHEANDQADTEKPLEIEIPRFITPIIKSDTITPIKSFSSEELLNTRVHSLPLTHLKDMDIIANRKMYRHDAYEPPYSAPRLHRIFCRVLALTGAFLLLASISLKDQFMLTS